MVRATRSIGQASQCHPATLREQRKRLTLIGFLGTCDDLVMAPPTIRVGTQTGWVSLRHTPMGCPAARLHIALGVFLGCVAR